LDSELQLQVLAHTPLTAVVRRALNDSGAEVEAWEAARIHGGIGAADAGVYRFTGTARSGRAARPVGGVRPWSLVLKVLQAPTAGTTYVALAVEGWNREVLTYQSGLLAALPAGLAAPRCFDIGEHAGLVWLWLEDVAEHVGPRWPVARFALAARHLGRLNGTYLAARPLPDYPWLQRTLLRWRVERNVTFWAAFDAARDEPWLRRCWPGDLGARAGRLWQRRQILLELLDHLPQPLVHGDADRRNLFARLGPAGEETVAIDWAFTGVAALGEELVNLVLASVLWFQAEPAALPELADRCLEGYLAGLADAGWRGDPRLARAGFVVAGALRYGPLLAGPLARSGEAGVDEVVRAMGRSADDWLTCWAAVRRFTFDQFDEAQTLIQSL
jgi:hypothetical protein